MVSGVAWRDGRLTVPGAVRGEFKTATLREISRTAPYTYDESLVSLEAVIDFYDRGGRPPPNLDREIRPLPAADPNKRHLKAFLRSLSG